MFSLQMKNLGCSSEPVTECFEGLSSRVISRVDPEMPLLENALRPLPRERLLELLACPLHPIEGEQLLLGSQPVHASVAGEIR